MSNNVTVTEEKIIVIVGGDALADVVADQANIAITKAAEAAASVSEAAASVSEAAASASEAAASASEAAASASEAAGLFDSFDDRYLGSKSADPATDNDGNALLEGALYWNTIDKAMRAWSGAAWVPAYTHFSVLPISKGGTGSPTQNFVDLTEIQEIGGYKKFANRICVNYESVLLGEHTGIDISNGEVTSNVGVGYKTLTTTVGGVENTAVGTEALVNATGSGNVALGYHALTGCSASGNVAVGRGGLAAASTAEGNTAVGDYALGNNIVGNSNTALGLHALFLASDNSNTAVGTGALETLTTGSGNIALGAVARTLAATDDNSVVIGTLAAGKGSNTVVLGNDDITATYLKGSVIIPDGTATAPALTFTNDTDIGMYRVGTNSLGFATDGKERMRCTPGGCLDIGRGTVTDAAIIQISSATTHAPTTGTSLQGIVLSHNSTPNASTAYLYNVQGFTKLINSAYPLSTTASSMSGSWQRIDTDATWTGDIDYISLHSSNPGVWAGGTCSGSLSAYSAGNFASWRTPHVYSLYSSQADFPAQTITSIARVSNVVTATVSGTNVYGKGVSITVAGVTDAGFNGTYTVTDATDSTVSWAQTAIDATSTGGTIDVGTYTTSKGRWGLYLGGTAPNYIAGSVGIGGLPVKGRKVQINGNITGASGAYGLLLAGTVQPDVTNAISIGTNIAVAAGTTLSSLTHFSAVQSTVSGTITTQVGFAVPPLLIAATNNYGFRGQIPAGTGRYNLYMEGTAQNYIAGDMQFAKTITATGTTGAQTINKTTGAINFAASATSLVVTNSLVTANSIIICTVGTNDTTMKSVSAVATTGSFTLYPNAAPTAETRVNFLVFN